MSKTETKWVAVHKGKYLIVNEHEVDFTGYGGSTETHYSFGPTKDIFKATLFDAHNDFPSHHWRKKDGMYELKKVTVTTAIHIE